jgi:hypothetical protein
MGDSLYVALTDDEIHKLRVGYDMIWDVLLANENVERPIQNTMIFLDLIIKEAE